MIDDCSLEDSATELVAFTMARINLLLPSSYLSIGQLIALRHRMRVRQGITQDVAGFGSDRTFRYRFRWVDVHHAVVDSSTGVRQPIAANVNSVPLIP
jgi:hypothetical protein